MAAIFFRYCIEYVEQYFPEIKIIRGRPEHPQSQGVVERSNGTLKCPLDAWMNDMGGETNVSADWTIGCHIVQAQINTRPHEGRGHIKPYDLYFGQKSVNHGTILIGDDMYSKITTNYAYQNVSTILEKITDGGIEQLPDNRKLEELIVCSNYVQETDGVLLYSEERRLAYNAEAWNISLVDTLADAVQTQTKTYTHWEELVHSFLRRDHMIEIVFLRLLFSMTRRHGFVELQYELCIIMMW